MWMTAFKKSEFFMWSFCPVIETFDKHPYFERCLSFFLFNPNMMGVMIMVISFMANPSLQPVSRDSQNCFQY